MQNTISSLKNKRKYVFLSPPIGVLLVLLLLFQSCSVTKHLPEDVYLLRKNKIEIESNQKRSEKEELKEQLHSLTAQKTNTYLLGALPYKVWLYNLRHKKYEKDSTSFQIKSRTVEAPVILDTTLIKKSKENMGHHLFNAGFFHHNINTYIDTSSQKAKVHYQIQTGNRHIIKKINYEIDDSSIYQILIQDSSIKYLNEHEYYSNTQAGQERNRIANLLKTHGYYYFTAENIIFELDTLHTTVINSDNLAGSIIDALLSKTASNYEITVNIKIENNTAGTSFKKYKMGNVVVYMNMTDTMSLGELYQLANQKEVKEDLQIIFKDKSYINEEILKRKILIQPGKQYSLRDYDQTIRLLTDLLVFQYIRIRYSAPIVKEGEEPVVNAIILLSPANRFEYGFNTEVSSGDIYILGTNLNTSITYNNIFKTANQLVLSGSWGIAFENMERKKLKLFSQTYGGNAKLIIPGLLLLQPELTNRNHFTQTEVSAGMNFMDRTNFFFLRNINSNIIYRISYPNYHQLNIKPAFINVLRLTNISDQFRERMDSIPAIKNAYQPVFMEGEGIEYIINSNPNNNQHKYYVKLGFEEAGLLLKAINQIQDIGHFSEYIRLDFDGRRYYNTSYSSLIFRFYGGVGIPYGNSRTLPYIKQYFAGGAYSLRGWRPRILGPGSYLDPNLNNSQTNLFIDQAGDIKLEFNTEYRFVITRMFANAISLNGAVFADAGNIWLAKKDSKLPSAEFNINRLMQDFAVSSGAGFRIDFGGFLVLRLDYALQVKKPYVLENYGWNLQNFQLANKAWRQENSYLSIAIGYPF